MTTSELFPEAAPDFSDPLGLLQACHQRILAQCETLERLARAIADEGASLQVSQAASQVHRYFTKSAALHHQDEELDLFPHLARQSLKLADRVHRLKHSHTELDQLWKAIAPLLARPGSITDLPAFTTQVEQFVTLQREHIAQENEELLDIAQHIFSADELRKIGRAMAERRGLSPRF